MSGGFLSRIKAEWLSARHRRHSFFWRCRMAAIDVFYLGLVLVAMFGFAAALAYYSHR